MSSGTASLGTKKRVTAPERFAFSVTNRAERWFSGSYLFAVLAVAGIRYFKSDPGKHLRART